MSQRSNEGEGRRPRIYYCPGKTRRWRVRPGSGVGADPTTPRPDESRPHPIPPLHLTRAGLVRARPGTRNIPLQLPLAASNNSRGMKSEKDEKGGEERAKLLGR